MRRFGISMPFVLGIVLLFCMISSVHADVATPPQHIETFSLQSGIHQGDQLSETAMVYSGVVEARDAAWLRVHFGAINLGKESYITVTAFEDGEVQTLNSETIVHWQNSTAYFNGDAVRIDLHVAPGDEDIYFDVDEVVVGDWVEGDGPFQESQCGPNDDRIPSSDPAAGRLLDIGCTAWLISDGTFISAGHCIATSSLVDVVQFNVPLSNNNGTINHPPVEDQFPTDNGTRVWSNGGVGNDWGHFSTFTNNLGETALDRQGAFFNLEQNTNTNTIRITGYGVDFDDGDLNQVQQTHCRSRCWLLRNTRCAIRLTPKVETPVARLSMKTMVMQLVYTPTVVVPPVVPVTTVEPALPAQSSGMKSILGMVAVATSPVALSIDSRHVVTMLEPFRCA